MCAFGASTWPLASCFVLHDGVRKMCALYFLYGVLLFCLHVLNVTMRNRVVCPLKKKKGIMLTDTGGVKPLMPYHFVRYNICTTFFFFFLIGYNFFKLTDISSFLHFTGNFHDWLVHIFFCF